MAFIDWTYSAHSHGYTITWENLTKNDTAQHIDTTHWPTQWLQIVSTRAPNGDGDFDYITAEWSLNGTDWEPVIRDGTNGNDVPLVRSGGFSSIGRYFRPRTHEYRPIKVILFLARPTPLSAG